MIVDLELKSSFPKPPPEIDPLKPYISVGFFYNPKGSYVKEDVKLEFNVVLADGLFPKMLLCCLEEVGRS